MTIVSIANHSTPKYERDILTSKLNDAMSVVNGLVLGKDKQVRLAFACLLAGGHLLIEDMPGTGKTILARSLAAVISLDFKRVQFTSDLMPSDILGVSIFNLQAGNFELHKGPVFTNILLADEINRAPPRAQSALLEAMAEAQVSIDKITYKLSPPFLVIATQNPIDLAGTYPLPSAQKDRFLFQLSMGYPSREHEIELMGGMRRGVMLDKHINPVLNQDDIIQLRDLVDGVHVENNLLSYAYDLIDMTRFDEEIESGLSPRASLDLVSAARALAFIDGRDYTTPEDFQIAFLPLSIHRIQVKHHRYGDERNIIEEFIKRVPVP